MFFSLSRRRTPSRMSRSTACGYLSRVRPIAYSGRLSRDTTQQPTGICVSAQRQPLRTCRDISGHSEAQDQVVMHGRSFHCIEQVGRLKTNTVLC